MLCIGTFTGGCCDGGIVSVEESDTLTKTMKTIIPWPSTSVLIVVCGFLLISFSPSVNDIRLSRGEPPLGFVGPLLYSLASSHPQSFRDILDGNNRCRTEEQTCCKEGFQATQGWVRMKQPRSKHEWLERCQFRLDQFVPLLIYFLLLSLLY